LKKKSKKRLRYEAHVLKVMREYNRRLPKVTKDRIFVPKQKDTSPVAPAGGRVYVSDGPNIKPEMPRRKKRHPRPVIWQGGAPQ